jgi:hypothetical protein
MPRRTPRGSRATRPRKKLARRTRVFRQFKRRLPGKRTRRRLRKRVTRAWRRSPRVLRWLFVVAATAVLWLGVNGMVQVVRKPSELFFPVSDSLHKTPGQTWRAYGSLFRAHSTDVMTPDLLAALAQVEGSGNPVARTYWRWSLSRDPLSLYRPASSAVGMYQFTDGTFAEARRYCIHDHVVVEDGPWDDFDSCWFNAFYSRLVPTHAIELTSAYLDRHVARILKRYPRLSPTLQARQQLATLIHLCGAGAGARFAQRGLELTRGQLCGTHDVRRYLLKVSAQQTRFLGLAASDSTHD